jgi:pantetheine-phosphate adenylyltransferase
LNTLKKGYKKMVIAVYPGCFDPITWGHLDIIKRSVKFCDRLVVAVGVNSGKKTLFNREERMKQIDRVVNAHVEFLDSTNIRVDSFEGLLVDFAKKVDAKLLVRGIRSVSDFEYEITIANANKLLAPNVQTIFMPTSPDLAVVSSSAVKEIGMHGGPLHHFVPPEIEKDVRAKFGFEQKPDSGFIKYGDQPSDKNCGCR